MLPPHLSPFVEENEDDYIPPERQEVIAMEKQILREENAGLEKDTKSGICDICVASFIILTLLSTE